MLRENGLRVERAYGDRSVKAQWKAADKSRAVYGVMLGRAEAEREEVAVKDLRSGEQVEVPRDTLVAWLLSTTRGRGIGMMRTDRAGDLRRRRHRPRRRGVRMGRQPSRPRRCRLPRHSRHRRDRAGRRRSREPRRRGSAPGARRVRGPRRGIGACRGRRARSTTRCPPARSRSVRPSLEMLSEAETVPFPIDDRIDADEVLRLRHRYLDLRRPRMQRNLRIRARVNSALRRSLDAQGFVEIETPMLIASTPEGARDFVVPSRLSPGSFYALPQSPQLFKQLLMVGGLDRYYQIARCLRDEDLRADRQFEFMQLDAEMSFADADDVMARDRRGGARRRRGRSPGRAPAPVERMTWHHAMEVYGSDKPDVRFGLELARPERGVRRHRVPRLPGAGGEGHAAPGRGRDVAGAGRQARRPREAARRGRPGVDAGAGARRARLAGGEVPERERAARAVRRARRRSRAICCWSSRARRGSSTTCSARCGSRSAARRSTRVDCTSSGWSTSRCSRDSTTTAARSRRTTRSRCRTPTTWRSSSTRPARTCSVCAHRRTTSC